MKFSLHLFVALLFICGIGIQAQTTVQTWDFESSLGDWVSGEYAATLALSDEQALSGSQSAKMVKLADSSQINLQNDVFEDVLVGDTLIFNVYLSAADLANVNGLQIFWHDNGWGWHAQWVNGTDLTGDAWNALKAVVPATTLPPQRIGLQLVIKSGSEATTPAMYVDDIAVVRPPFAIAIDAEKDAWYENMSMDPDSGYLHIQAFHNKEGFPGGPPAGNEDFSIEQWCAWDADWFYLYAEVTDDIIASSNTNVWNQDCIELKLDGVPNDSSGSTLETRLTFLQDSETEWAADSLSPIADADKMVAKKVTADGWAIEFAIKIAALGGSETIIGEVDTIFGMAINYHDNDGSGPESGLTWAAVLHDYVWRNTLYHGTVTFMKNHKVNFVATNSIRTTNINTLPYDGTVPTLGVIDGQMDPFYKLLTGPDDGYLQIKSYAFQPDYGMDGRGNIKGDEDFSAKVWSAWDETWFYLYTEVTDDTIMASHTGDVWRNDCIELKIDGSPTGAAGQEGVSKETRLTALGPGDNPPGLTDSITNFFGAENSKFVRLINTPGDGDWTLEMAIKIDTLGGSEKIDGAVDSIFGLGIHFVDNDNTDRASGLVWASRCTDRIWNFMDEMGTVKFLAGNKVQFIPVNNITGQTNPVPFDGTPFYITPDDGHLDPFFRALEGPSSAGAASDGYVHLRNFVYMRGDNQPRAGEDGDDIEVRDADFSSKIWTAWDEDWWYIYNQVTDNTVAATDAANPWNNDCIEIKIDCVIDPADSSAGQPGRWETRLNILGVADTDMATDSLGNIADSLKKIYRSTASGGDVGDGKIGSGWILEFAIGWDAMVSGDDAVVPGVGTQFGAALQNFDNDEDPPGRTGTIQWAAELFDDVWNEVKRMGTVEFLADNHLELDPSNVYGRENELPYNGDPYWWYVDGMEPGDQVPLVYDLKQNYPNPFNPVTNIVYSIPQAGKVNLTVYNILGQKVATLVDNETIKPGIHTIEFDAAHMATGMYFYRIEFQNKMLVKKMMLIK